MKKSDLKYLIELLDDDQEEVRTEIIRRLEEYGSALEIDIQEYSSLLDSKRKSLLDPLLKKNRIAKIKEDWKKLIYVKDEYAKLEFACRLITQYHYGVEAFITSLNRMDELAVEFSTHFPYGNEIDLAKFLFQYKGLRGNKEDYYNPLNSNILYTIEEGKGLPITLCVIYMLIGNRLNMNIEGCSFPGHFLAKIKLDGEIVLVDCYNRGALIYEDEIVDVQGISKDVLRKIIKRYTTSSDIIRRIANNLINAYHQKKDFANENLFESLLKVNV